MKAVIIVEDRYSPKRFTFRNEKSLNEWLNDLKKEMESDTGKEVSLEDLKENFKIYSSDIE